MNHDPMLPPARSVVRASSLHLVRTPRLVRASSLQPSTVHSARLPLRSARLRTALTAVCVLLGLGLLLPPASAQADPPTTAIDAEALNREAIQPWPANPRYWQFRGEPVLLVGGSDDDNPFQWPPDQLIPHLDALAGAGGNYIRCTMSDRKDKGFERYPFRQRPDGRYDLNEWDDVYWARFAGFLEATAQRKIIVQIEVWDRFDYARDNWLPHPYNPTNNVNYTYATSGFEPDYPDHAGANRQPFFFTTPAQRHNQVVFPFQQRFVDRMLSYTLRHPHVLYCMDNETSGEAAWGAYWADYIKQKAAQVGRRVFVTEMWDDWNLQGPSHRHTFDHPERYDFADVSQNNHQKGDTHWHNFQWVRAHLAAQPRPLNTVKTYGADTGRYGTSQDGLERWWRHLLGGAAAVRFHRPDSGIGLSAPALASIRAARQLEAAVKLWDLEPHLELLGDREPNEAFAAARPGHTYVVFFPNGGQISLAMAEPTGPWRLRWLEISRGEWAGAEASPEGRSAIRLETPRPGLWIALVQR